MKIIFFGTGSIGTRYINILQKQYRHDLFAFRFGKSKKTGLSGIPEVFSWDDFDKVKPNVAFITNPTALHIKTATRAAERNCALYLEKPVSSDLVGLNRLLTIIKEKRLTTYVAYNLRFHPVIEKLKDFCQKNKPLHMRIICTSYLPHWRSNQDYKKNYSSHAKMGGGVILDLSHEIDYISYLLGEIKTMSGSFGRQSNLTVDAEDYADILINTKKSPVNLHLNFMSHLKQRTIQIDFQEMGVVGDLINGTVRIYNQEKLMKRLKFKAGMKETYEKELAYFFDNINNSHMMNNLPEAAPLFRQIITFKNKK